MAVSAEQFLRWFDLIGLQRHIKVLGIFARLWYRDGKPRLPARTCRARCSTCMTGGAALYRGARALRAWLERRVMPLFAAANDRASPKPSPPARHP